MRALPGNHSHLSATQIRLSREPQKTPVRKIGSTRSTLRVTIAHARDESARPKLLNRGTLRFLAVAEVYA